METVRFCAWYRLFLFNQVIIKNIFYLFFNFFYEKLKQENMFKCVNYLILLLEKFSQLNPLFSYIPEYYLETSIDCFHALRRGDPPFNFIEGYIMIDH